MKKYFTLFAILLVAIFARVNLSLADAKAPTPLTPAEEKAFANERLQVQKAQQEKAQKDLDDERAAAEAEIKAEKDAAQKEIDAKKQAAQDALTANQTIVTDIANQINPEDIKNSTRLSVAMDFVQRTDNLSKIAAKLKTRIAKLADAGVDTTSAEDLETKAETSIVEAQTDEATLKTQIIAGATLDILKSSTTAIKHDLEQATIYLNQSVELLKAKTQN